MGKDLYILTGKKLVGLGTWNEWDFGGQSLKGQHLRSGKDLTLQAGRLTFLLLWEAIAGWLQKYH